ncbi:MAG: hypothetical protein HY983_00245 [Candidatus Magasanikbacteria bacterium]|nr:hypothetical protein [Candidatus Magasanikbacteria bacterium]
MPKDLTKENAPVGKVVYEWLVKEYEQYERSRRWYLIAGLLGVVCLVYAVATANYLFALILVLFAIVLYLHEMQPPLNVYFAITETGIILGKKYYRYSELADFWLIYNPPEVKTLYFRLNNMVKHRLQIPLLDYDPRPIRNYLNQFLSEDLEQEDEPVSDRMARILKIH